MAEYYERATESEFAAVRLTYDADESGLPNDGEDGLSAVGSTYMGGPGRGWVL